MTKQLTYTDNKTFVDYTPQAAVGCVTTSWGKSESLAWCLIHHTLVVEVQIAKHRHHMVHKNNRWLSTRTCFTLITETYKTKVIKQDRHLKLFSIALMCTCVSACVLWFGEHVILSEINRSWIQHGSHINIHLVTHFLLCSDITGEWMKWCQKGYAVLW